MIFDVVKCRRRAFTVLLVSCAIIQPGWAQLLRGSEPKQADGQRFVDLENDRIRVSVLPDLGGRVVRYEDKATGRNHVWQSPQWDTAGIWDKEGIWPTANLSNHAFHYSLTHTDSRLQLKLWADLGNLRVEKLYTLQPGSTRLACETSYRNVSKRPIRYSVSQVFRLAVGGSAGHEDYAVYPEGEGLVKKNFTSLRGDRPDNSSPSWFVVSDVQLGESLLIEPEHNPLLTEQTLQFDEKYVQLEYLTRRHLAQPGEILKLSWELLLIKNPSESPETLASPSLTGLLKYAPASFRDLGEHLLISGQKLAGFSLPNRVIRKPAPLRIEARALGVGKGVPPVEVRVDGKPADSFPDIPMAGLKDGAHRLGLSFEGLRSDFVFATVDEPGLRKRIEKTEKQIAKLATEARRSGDPARLSAVASCQMRVEDARRKFILGPRFEEGRNNTYEISVNQLNLEMSRNMRPTDLDYVLRALQEAERWTEALARGADPFPSLRGLFQRAFYSRIDGSVQPYVVYVPQDYDGKTALPLLVVLHGSGGDQWEILQTAANFDGASPHAVSLEQEPGKPRFIVCAPLARGAAGYEHVAEIDVLQTMDEVQRDYRVDRDRVYLAGWSMGGTGTWTLAARYPQRFAAILPIAGAADSRLSANLGNMPSWNYFGLGDKTVSPGYLRVTENAVRRHGIPYHDGFQERPFVWGPDADHWVGYRMAGSWDEIESILWPYRRNSFPQTISLEATDLRHSRAYWAQIESFERYFEPARVRAEVHGNRIRIQSTNVRELTLFLSSSLVDMSRAIAVVNNGQEVYGGPARAHLSLNVHAETKGLRKKAGLSGPISDAFYDSFLVVFGANGNEEEVRAARREAEAIRTLGNRGVRYFGIPAKKDVELTSEDIERYHLVLIGANGSNRWINKLKNKLPIQIEDDSIVAGRRRFKGEDVALRLIYPNPLNPRKYVLICTAVNAQALAGIGSIPLPYSGWVPRSVEPDALITGRGGRTLAAFVFDGRWSLPDEDNPVIGRLDGEWGQFRADALRQAARADIALVDPNDHSYSLEPGSVRRQDLSLANTWSPTYSFSATGSQIKSILEHGVDRLIDHARRRGVRPGGSISFPLTTKPLAVSGFSYRFSTERPSGHRVSAEGLSMDRQYRVAATEYILTQALDGIAGPGYLGWLPEIEVNALSEIEGQLNYLNPSRLK